MQSAGWPGPVRGRHGPVAEVVVCIAMLPTLGHPGLLRYGLCVVTTYKNDGLYLSKLADVFGDLTRRGIFSTCGG